MKLSITHATTFSYSSSVRDSMNDVRLCPVSDEWQQCQSFSLHVVPTEYSILRRLDFYMNQVHHIEVPDPHRELRIEARSVVETFADTRCFDRASDSALLPLLARSEQFYDFVSASERVPLVPAVIHVSKEVLPDGMKDVQEAVLAVMGYVYQSFTYEPGYTNVETPVVEVFESRRGVCQDFAHVMIALCRCHCIPARYVSGYFHIEKAVEGTADDNMQSHAWVECYLPDIGWVGYDPTHHRRICDRYVKVAVGRDYSDVRPVAGTYRGDVDAQLDVTVRVEKI
ncbi:transglutaminase family protein [Coraliomargarita parva]|uniref:transglutaminase family protein n=1 Tax=Coraliomargarita parva TaxID=3014050 RepID=UPI0022B57C32|nr:transglutaminase family protein [Coraliomargarita parva]